MIEDKIKEIKEKLKVFDIFHFEEEPHIYWWIDKDGIKRQATVSMTSLIHSYSQPFFPEEIAPFTAKKLGIPVQEVLDKWKYENNFAKVKGTHIHAFNEYKWQDKPYMYPKEDIIKQFGSDVLEPVWGNLTKIANKFYDEFHDRIIPVGLELVIGDEELSICGSIDFLCYSKKLNSLVILDYKSNKEIKFNSYYNKRTKEYQMMTGCLSHLQDCNYIHYSLQLNGYQYILEKNTGLKLHNEHFLVWMNENNDTFEIYKTKDLKKEAIAMIWDNKKKKDKENECPF